ncbi:20628_t:CDS:2 [Cetraspora pellucida]|uniref:20628_t:CDS:1 n=1 Tax=Cetraspora pellucida TaxID=1433469 RepID=A0A9N9EPS0_9GLOM|nr:20628_t:CDS:2 [Cetraspora pellucida]
MNLLYKILNTFEVIDIVKILSLTICFYIFRFYYKYFTRPNPLPGPIPIPLIGTFEIFRVHIDIDAWFYKLAKKYGQNGVFELNLIGNRQIVITRADYVGKLMSPLSEEQQRKHLMRTANNGLLDMFDLDYKGVGLNHSYNFWKFNRQIFSNALKIAVHSDETVKIVNNLFEEMTDYWMNLRKFDENSAIVDTAAWMRRFTNDFISVITTGDRTFAIKNYHHKLKTNEVTEEIMESEEFVECISTFFDDNQMIFIPKLLSHFPLINGRVNKMVHTLDYVYKRLIERIRKRRKEVEKVVKNSNFEPSQLRNNLLTSLVIANTPYETTPQKNVDPSLLRPMTDDEIRGIMFDAFAAGTDTRLLEEIETVFKDDPNRPLTMEDINKLRYCEAIIKETSRIRPTVSMVSRYIDQPDEIAGHKWPADLLFIMYVRGINNNPLHWKDPEKFIPERFYDASEMENQHRFAFSMFGGGLRMCLGRNLAMMEMKIILASLYRKFDVELVDMKAPLKVTTSTVTICKNLDVRIIPK